MKNEKVLVIGGGISGFSCALLLQLFGYSVRIISREIYSSSTRNPEQVSSYPSASVIPHSCNHPEMESIFSKSHDIFSSLKEIEFPGLKVNRHFELFHDIKKLPFYVDKMKNFSVQSSKWIPTHPSLEIGYHWSFDCLFADWPVYFPNLVSLFHKNGGELVHKEVSREDIFLEPESVIINCTEMNGAEFSAKIKDPILYRGHLLKISGAPLLKTQDGQTVSYNFTPGKKYYRSESGNEQDVYCYPREDGLVLGGSRQLGRLSEKYEWDGEEVIEPKMDVNGCIIPEQIYRMNRDLIYSTFGIDIDLYKNIEAYAGYRFMGDESPGLRLDKEESGDKLFIHNYGHGGAGVTLSWGCAFDVLKLLQNTKTDSDVSISEVTEKIRLLA